MKRFLSPLLCASALMVVSTQTWAEGGLRAGDTVAVCGDSITQQKQYSVFIEEYLLMCQPVADLHANQFGLDGETSGGFLGRITNDVLPFHPTVATTCYGMNDGGYNAPLSEERAANYRKSQTAIVETFKKAGVHFIVLGSPGCVDSFSFRDHPVTAAVFNQTLWQLRDIAREVAAAEGVAFADVHQPMIDVMAKAKARYGEKYLLSQDGVHPLNNGHVVMAYAFLKALGCDGNIGTITVDLASGIAGATAGHKVLGMTNGNVELESSRYPFCLTDGPEVLYGTRSVAELFPFYADLNRLMLVVKNPGAARLKVTFGSKSKEFSAEDAAKGINLAEEFPDNPFVEPFKKVDAAVRAQQKFETPLVRTWLHGGAELTSQYPETKSDVDSLNRKLMAKDAELMAASSKAVVPVKYTLKVDAAQ